MKTVQFLHMFCVWHLAFITKWSVFETRQAREIYRIKTITVFTLAIENVVYQKYQFGNQYQYCS